MHPPSNRMPYERNGRATQSRRSRGARRAFLIVASFRTWRGSEAFVARDPNINVVQQFRIIWITALRREFSLARADCEYRAPLAPHLAWPQKPVSARRAMRSMPTLGNKDCAPGSRMFLQPQARLVIRATTTSLSTQTHLESPPAAKGSQYPAGLANQTRHGLPAQLSDYSLWLCGGCERQTPTGLGE